MLPVSLSLWSLSILLNFFFFNFYLFPQGVVVEAGSHCGTQAKLELGILLSVHNKCWNYHTHTNCVQFQRWFCFVSSSNLSLIVLPPSFTYKDIY